MAGSSGWRQQVTRQQVTCQHSVLAWMTSVLASGVLMPATVRSGVMAP